MKSTEVGTVMETPVTSPQERSEKKITWCLWLKGPGPGWTFAQGSRESLERHFQALQVMLCQQLQGTSSAMLNWSPQGSLPYEVF